MRKTSIIGNIITIMHTITEYWISWLNKHQNSGLGWFIKMIELFRSILGLLSLLNQNVLDLY